MRFAGKLKKVMIALVAAVTFSTAGLGIAGADLQAQAASTPSISAKAAIAVDASTGQILYDKNSSKPMAIATMTKMLRTYLTIHLASLEHLHMQARLRFRLTRLEYQRMLFQQLYRMLLSIFLSQSLLISTRK